MRVANWMNERGDRYRHSIISLNGAATCRSRVSADIAVEFCPAPAASRNPLASVLGAWRVIGRTRPDVLLTYNWGAMDWALAHTLRPVCRHVHVEDGFGPDEAEKQFARRIFFRRLALKGAHRIVVPSVTLQEIATRQWGFDASRIELIPNGIACDRFTPSGDSDLDREDDALVVGTLASLRSEKNLGMLIEAFAEIARRHSVRLVIAGDGPERARLETLSRTLGVAERVRFLGRVDDIAKVLAGFDVYALTSVTEQLPISLLEAMSAGKPVAAVDVGDVKRALSFDNRAHVVAKGDPIGFVAALESLLADAALRKRLGAQNRMHVCEHYSYARMTNGYDRVLSP